VTKLERTDEETDRIWQRVDASEWCLPKAASIDRIVGLFVPDAVGINIRGSFNYEQTDLTARSNLRG
jgi:hypothetical protein